MCDFFDSIGEHPNSYGFDIPFRLKSWNSRCLQSPVSNKCSLFVLFWMVQHAKGLNLNEILSRFVKNLECNDEIVDRFYNNIAHVRPMNRNDAKMQSCCIRLLVNKF